MQQENVQSVGAQSRQDGIDAFQDVVATEIKALRCSGWIALPANPAFPLKHNSVPEGRCLLQHPAENLFGPSTAVDIGVVEEIRSCSVVSGVSAPQPPPKPMQPKAKRDTSRSVWGIFIVSIGLSF